MENPTSKHRTPSQCREWERLRRNRFNDAISKLGDIVKEILKDKPQFEASNNVQYPKIEIVQKAILCLTNCVQEKTQLKAEILALQVKLEAEKNVKPDKKDACIQVSAVVCKKNKNGKFVKLVMLQKSKKKNVKEKSSVPNETVKQKIEIKPISEENTSKKNVQTLPKLLPLTSSSNKKGIENTIVMLPSAPYISFPQRPLLFPAVPPTIVFLDSNLQPINKPATIPIINRNNGDMTKTTMVNVLPISAYSRPMSATKTKKNNVRSKQNIKRKPVKKGDKQTAAVSDEPAVTNVSKITTSKENINSTNANKESEDISKTAKISDGKKELNESNDKNIPLKTNGDSSFDNKESMKQQETVSKPSENSETNSHNSNAVISTSIDQKPDEVVNNELREINIDGTNKEEKICREKELLIEEKDKVTKIPNILETALCDNVVDGGNARLELAEEFLAASPTAAFLMSFPLVSGNRADSPADEHHNIQTNPKENHQRRNEVPPLQPPYFPKSNDLKEKVIKNIQNLPNITHKQTEQKFISNATITKEIEPKVPNLNTNSSNDNPFLNLTMPSLIPTTCALTDSTFSLDFDCSISKANQPIGVASSSNFFYKSDALNSTKTSIYSTSNISSGHEFNSIGLYPCAMEKFATKNKSDFANMEESLMKIGPSRLTYDIDLGWSHKGFDFVTCTTTASTFNKDNILTSAPTQYSSTYNPFNPEFHVPLVANSNKKDMSCKAITSFPEAITSFYSQPTNLWSEDMTFYTSNNFSKNFTPKPQNFAPMDHNQTTNVTLKSSTVKQYETKPISDIATNHLVKPITEGPSIVSDKYTKKSPSKMHINWMTSEIRPMQNNCNPSQVSVKENHKPLYPQNNIPQKKQDHNEGNYFPINMQNFPSQVTQEEFQVWPTTRPAGTTEISIEPPPINLPTLVGDLALGPHEKKKNDAINRILPQTDLQNCNNFFSVTQLMNRSSDVVPSRYQGANMETQKTNPSKQSVTNISGDSHRKVSRLETHLSQPCYVFNETKPVNYDTMGHFSQSKQKNNKSDKSAKNAKTSYSAEALLRGGPCNQKAQDTTISKFMLPSQKFNDFNVTQDSGVAQVSHFPPLLEYSDNSYAGQQFSGTTLYNSTTNTISNSFYSNFMPGSGNLMTGNYTSGHFQSEFIEYNQPAECNYTNYKYDDLKMKANTALVQDKPPPIQYKASRRESTTKHKLECSKKESSKKCNSKRAKLTNDAEEWNETSHLLWQSKATKRHPNISEDFSFPHYVGNQIPAGGQYQSELFNTHLMSSNMQNVSHNIDRSLATFPPTSRANFNLSTIFPEITMKVQ